jgi:hypothetical protein
LPRLAESDERIKALMIDHADKVEALNKKLEEASKKAKDNASNASRADSSTFTLEILELR